MIDTCVEVRGCAVRLVARLFVQNGPHVTMIVTRVSWGSKNDRLYHNSVRLGTVFEYIFSVVET